MTHPSIDVFIPDRRIQLETHTPLSMCSTIGVDRTTVRGRLLVGGYSWVSAEKATLYGELGGNSVE